MINEGGTYFLSLGCSWLLITALTKQENDMGTVTQLAQERAIRQKPVTDLCRWSDAFETVATANLKFMFAWQRTVLRVFAK